MTEDVSTAAPRDRILAAALALLDEHGEQGVTTRAVTARASVTAPAIYRLFGDMKGLLEAAAEQGLADWVAEKGAKASSDDPVQALRDGWDDAMQFGLQHPGLYRIANAHPGASSAMTEGRDLLRAKIDAVARAGRLRVNPEHAAMLMHSTGLGVTLTLLDTPPEARDTRLSTLAREATIAAITTGPMIPGAAGPAQAAITLRALLPDTTALRPAELVLLQEWLDRIAEGPS